MKRKVAFLLTVLMCCSLMCSAILPAAMAADAPNQKISESLRKELNDLADDALVRICVMLNAPSQAEIDATVPFPEDMTSPEQVDAYVSALFRTRAEVYAGIAADFAKNYLDENELIQKGEDISYVTAVVAKSKIASLAALDEVLDIDQYGVPASAAGQGGTADFAASEKITENLSKEMNELPDNALIRVLMWLKAPSQAEIDATVTPPDDLTSAEQAEAYIASIFKAREEAYLGITSDFVKNHLDETEALPNRGRDNPYVTAVLTKSRIASLAALDEVTEIDQYGVPAASTGEVGPEDPASAEKIAVNLRKEIEHLEDDALVRILVMLKAPSYAQIDATVPFPEDPTSPEQVDAYASALFKMRAEVYAGIAADFANNYLDESELIRRGEDRPYVTAVVTKSKIAALSTLDEVLEIDQYGVPASATGQGGGAEPAASDKITAGLLEEINDLSNDALVRILVTLKAPSYAEIDATVPFPEDPTSPEQVEAYASAILKTRAEVYAGIAADFANNYLDESELIHRGEDLPYVTAVVTKSKIASLAALDEVLAVDKYGVPASGTGEEPEQPCEHDYADVVTAPTCTEGGYTTYTCSKCGDKYTDDEVPALDHDFKDGVCTRCGAWDDLPSLISVDLQEQMKIMGDDARVMVAIDLKGLDQDFVLSEIAKESGLDENTVKKVLNGEAALADSMAYIDAQRAVLKRLYTKYNNDFLAAYLPDLPADCRYYVADTHAAIWASLKKEEIMNIAWKDQVFSMGYVSYAYDPLIPGDMESPNQPCEHDYNAVVKVPTCTESGYTIYTCTKCNDKYISDEIAALEHSWDEGEVTKEPSETENGERTFTCSRCGEKKTESIPVKEHVHNYIEVKTAPTCTEDGYSVFTCACGRSYKGDEVPALGHDFKDGVCTRCKAKDPDYEEPVIEPFRFDDVKDSKQFYFAPVYWAVDQKITRGTSEKLFSPDEGCTRGQVVTFLWRAAGEPEPTKAENPFQDVKGTDYFYKAVLWAVDKGITKGTSADKFSPDATCTRGQIVTFLYRAEGTPEIAKKSKPFHDVDEGQYYADAVAWAVENGVTTGKSAETFAPEATCTRGEIVTFLFRCARE